MIEVKAGKCSWCHLSSIWYLSGHYCVRFKSLHHFKECIFSMAVLLHFFLPKSHPSTIFVENSVSHSQKIVRKLPKIKLLEFGHDFFWCSLFWLAAAFSIVVELQQGSCLRPANIEWVSLLYYFTSYILYCPVRRSINERHFVNP